MASDRLWRVEGVWYGWFYDEHTNRVRFSTRCKNKRAAKVVLAKAEMGAFGIGPGLRGYKLLDALESLVTTGCLGKSAATVSMYAGKSGHLLRLLGGSQPLVTLKRDAVAGYIQTRQTEGASASTIYKELVTLRRALRPPESPPTGIGRPWGLGRAVPL